MSENQSYGPPPPEPGGNPNPYQQRGPRGSQQWHYHNEQNGPQNPNSGTPKPQPSQTPGYQQPPGAGQRPSPYYQAPQYARPGQMPMPTREKQLSNSTALLALGAMFIAAALGIVITLTGNPGRGLLIGVGLCALIAGGVIAYAALKGRGAGWFLAVSIVGAILALPTTLFAGAAVSYDLNVRPYEGSVDFSVENENFNGPDWTGGRGGFSFQNKRGAEQFSSDLAEVYATDTFGILDLTDLDAGLNRDYVVYAEDSYLRILLRTDQLPDIYAADVVDSLFTVSEGGLGTGGIPWSSLSGVTSPGPVNIDYLLREFGLTESNAANLIGLDISAHYSFVEVVFVGGEGPGGFGDPEGTRGPTPQDAPQSGSPEDDQE